MNRKLPIFIDRSTWPTQGVPPFFPRSFKKGLSSYDLNVPAMLLMIGYLTTPVATTGVTLSEFWAWVRYLAAITPNDHELKLTRSFAELDPHQKTILSDDFGMGVSILWLTDKLDLDLIVDGRYFMQQYASFLNVVQHRAAKRGPNKTPDFVARDTNGRWHVIECKGTQSGVEYRNRQLNGGLSQKRSLVFPRGYVGQRLVCGLSIGVEDGEGSALKIIDPVPDEPVEIKEHQLSLANDAATRGVMSKLLRMSGYEFSADVMASPIGSFTKKEKDKYYKTATQRYEFTNKRNAKAREELSLKDNRIILFNNTFIGRETRLELPRAIQIGRHRVSNVIVRQGINREALSELADRPTIESVIQDEKLNWLTLIGKSKTRSDGLGAILEIGKIFRAQIELRP